MITKLGKEAVNTAAEDASGLEAAAGAGAMGAGGLLTKKMIDKGHLTGRETMYHGTDSDSARNIRRQGLQPTTDASAVNTDALKSDHERYRKSLGKTYATNSKLMSRVYAAQTALKRNMLNAMNMDSDPHILTPDIVKIKAPTWKFKSVMNPEVDMPIREWFERSKQIPQTYDELNPMMRAGVKANYNMYRNARVFDHAIPAEYIKGEKYKRLGLKELGQYITKNKLRFGKGMLGAGAGIGLAGYGAKTIADRFRGADGAAPSTESKA